MKLQTTFNRSPIRYLLVMLLAFALPAHAGVSAKLSSQVTNQGQPVRLTLEMEGEQTDPPDLTVLENNFEILERATQQSISIINGKMSSKRSLVLTLLPKQSGTLTIPAIPFGDQQTEPLTLDVTDAPIEQDANQQLAWVELSLNKAKAYPEEEVILTLKLFQQASVRGEHLDDPVPSLSDTRIELLDESQYTTEKDGEIYRVLERTYGLFAYQTGRLEIAAVSFRGRTGGGSIFSLLDDPFRQRRQVSRPIRTVSEPVSLEISPIPTTFTGSQWLPAKHLILEDAGLDSQSPVTAGIPLTRRIMLIADGLMASQLPSITQEVPEGIKPYEERPHLTDTPRKSGISSSRQHVITLIPTQAGHYTLPPIEVAWWNTELDKQETSQLPAIELDVMANPAATAPIDTFQDTVDTPTNEIAPQPVGELLDGTSLAADNGNRSWLVWLLGAAWLATLLAWWYTHRKTKTTPTKSSQPETAPPSLAQQELAEAIEELKRAYNHANAPAARESWLKWGQAQWPENPPKNLTRLAGRCDAELSVVILALEKTLYSPGEESGWAEFDPDTLNVPHTQEPPRECEEEHLLPLNP
ncbi:MAG: BatD family protein [Candidatus Thiodiazotropha sp. (ex Monitilora ramsayi)]|nr:BatD family protein [Candidatus Thiodiazotropha sp. (ex Monitilora ramsayi)]